MILKQRYFTLGVITALGVSLKLMIAPQKITSQDSHRNNSTRIPANSASPEAQDPANTNLVKVNKEQVITKIGSDHPSIQGKPIWVSTVAKGTELTFIKYSKGNIPVQKINEQGVTLFKYNLLGSDINIVKLRRGWPSDVNAQDENPSIDPKTAQLSSKGGRVTLSYLSELNLLSKNKYKHLPLQIIQDSNSFKLVTTNGSPANFLFATSQDNKKGLRSIEPVSPSRFAILAGQHVIEESSQVANRQSSKDEPSPSSFSESVTAKSSGASISGSAE